MYVKLWFPFFSSFPGSIVKASQKTFTSVQGGKAEYSAKLAWENKEVSPASKTYYDWIQSTIENPTVIDFEVRMRYVQMYVRFIFKAPFTVKMYQIRHHLKCEIYSPSSYSRPV